MKTYTGTRNWLASVSSFALVLAASAGFSCQEPPSTPGDITPGHARLVRALSGYRMTEPRFTGGFSYAPCTPRSRPDGLIPLSDCSPLPDPFGDRFEALANALRDIRRDLETQPGPASLRASAVQGMILRGERRALDRWVERLEEAVRASSEDAGLRSDLAAAYLLRAQEEDAPLDLVRSLAEAGQALELDPELAEARFNHALALQHLYLVQPAIRSWERYLEIDGDSEWAGEARSRIAGLEELAPAPVAGDELITAARRAADEGDDEGLRELVRSSPAELRRFAETVFAEWAVNEGGEPTQLRLAEALGRAFAEAANDPLVQDAAERLANSEPNVRRRLANGHQHFAKGVKAYDGARYAEAVTQFAVARRLFEESSSSFAALARYRQGHSAYRLGETSAALELCRAAALESSSYPYLRGRCEWLCGTILLERVEPAEALAAYRQALTAFKSCGHLSHQASIHSLLANTYGYLADPEEAWKAHYRALRTVTLSGDFDRLPVILSEAAGAVSQAGQYRLATALQNEALVLDLLSEDPISIAGSFWWRSLIHFRGGDLTQAWADLEQAEEYSLKIPGDTDREMTQAGLQTLRGSLVRDTEPATAVALLTRAFDAYQEADMRYLMVDILLERARANLALHRFNEAERDLERGIEEYDEQRRRVHGVRSRISFFERAEGVFDEMVRLQLDQRKDEVAAFTFAEQGKARGLLDAMEIRNLKTREPGQGTFLHEKLQNVLGEDQAAVEYFQLDDRILAWLVTRESMELVEMPVDSGSLERAVLLLHESLTEDTFSFADASLGLGRLIWEPIRDRLTGFRELVIVPDRSLHTVPFAALIDPADGRFLVEDFTLTTAPSAASYVVAVARVRPRWLQQTVHVLAIGDPARTSTNDYPPLVNAREEAMAAARLYPGSVLLTDDATPERFLAEIDRFDILHVATHAIANSDAPFRSRLLLAPSNGYPSGELFADKILERTLTRPQLAILSACSTAVGHNARLEGVSDLGRAFIAAGVPVTLATLWNVPDLPTREMLKRFYTHLNQPLTPSEALRRAQLGLLNEQDSRVRESLDWAAFVLIGAGIPVTHAKGDDS